MNLNLLTLLWQHAVQTTLSERLERACSNDGHSSVLLAIKFEAVVMRGDKEFVDRLAWSPRDVSPGSMVLLKGRERGEQLEQARSFDVKAKV